MPLFGKKTPISRADLAQKLTELSNQSDQFGLTNGSPETDFIVERKIVDASGFGIAGIDKLEKSYKAYLILDEEAHEARYNEEMTESGRELNISLEGGAGVSTEKKFFRGKVIGDKEFGKELGFKRGGDPTSLGKVYDYKFDVNKVRSPIKKLVEDSAWKFKQVILRKDATYGH